MTPPAVVTNDVLVAVSDIPGLTVIVSKTFAVAPDASVAVTVSVIVRACVDEVEVKVDASLTKAVVGVDVSMVTPELRPEREKVFAPEPEAVVYTVVEAAFPAVTAIDVGPVNVGAALTMTVTKSRATPPAESVTVIVSK